ncbi:hypothetical protein DMC30DRAFT_387865 [Rhodotorula diobovata]|uniref:N-acetyl-D-glucosamine kinase n=1 Tax=Rhodotorula diobovata TaxID=5288 RepID=A0A5C5G4M6_9BASI|nr:hypothetical protein DMC30DRAFT_387865 [Rhodotorula diobovata]
MPSVDLPRWHLCVDGGGTAVKVVVASSDGAHLASATGGPCNVKSVGASTALATIVAATRKALSQIPDLSLALDGLDPLLLPVGLFTSVWLALAGILHKSDVDAFAPLAARVFGFLPDDPALRITNDGQLLGAPCLAMAQVDTAIALVAGTGSVALAFAKDSSGRALRLIGVDGGWGYLLGDEGSGFAVARIAIRRLLAAHDAATTASLRDPFAKSPPLLALFSDLLATFGVADAAELVDRTYADHSLPTDAVPPSFTSSESNRKLWIAVGAPVVLAYAFGASSTCRASVQMAQSIVEEAVSPLVGAVERLAGGHVDPRRALLSLGGGMWRTEGYRDLLVRGLEKRGLEFAAVKVVESAAAEGAHALCAQAAPGP